MSSEAVPNRAGGNVGSGWWVGAYRPLSHFLDGPPRPVVSGDQVYFRASCGDLVLATVPIVTRVRGLRRCPRCVGRS